MPSNTTGAKRTHDKELISREADHLTNVNGPTVQFGQINQKGSLCSKFYKRVLVNSMRICSEHTIRGRLLQSAVGEKASQISTGYSIFSSSSFATHGHLLDQASCRQSDQFSSNYQEKGLVISSYSSAAEFPIAITNTLREQQGATQIPGI